jgi:hypothetical protein
LRPLGLLRPSTRTWRQQAAGSQPRCIGDYQACAHQNALCGRERLVPELSEGVIAPFQQFASKREAGAVTDRTPFVGPPRVRVGGGYGSRRKVAVGSDRGRAKAVARRMRGHRRGAERSEA